MGLIDMSMWHHAAPQWGSSARTVGASAIGAFITPDYPKEGDQLRMPDDFGKGSIKTLTTRLRQLDTDDQLIRMKMGSWPLTAQFGAVFLMQSNVLPHWSIQDAGSGNNWNLLDRNGTIQATFAIPLTGPTVLDKVKIRWQNSSSGTFQMWVNGVSVVSVSGKAFDRTSSANSAIKFYGTFDAGAARTVTIANFLMDTAVSDNGTDDWYVPKYITGSTGDGDTNAAGTASPETFDVNSWAEIVDNDGTRAGYTGTNGTVGSGAYTDKSGQGGPLGDSEILPAWAIRGTSWGLSLGGTLAEATNFYGRWDGDSTVTVVSEGFASGQSHYFAPDGTSPSPGKTETGFTGFKRQSGSGDIQLVESAVFCAVDVVPVAGGTPYYYNRRRRAG